MKYISDFQFSLLVHLDKNDDIRKSFIIKIIFRKFKSDYGIHFKLWLAWHNLVGYGFCSLWRNNFCTTSEVNRPGMQSSKPTYSEVDIYGNLYLIMFDTFVSPTSSLSWLISLIHSSNLYFFDLASCYQHKAKNNSFFALILVLCGGFSGEKNPG